MSSTTANDEGGFAQVIPAYEAALLEQRSSLGDFSVDAIPTMERLAACYSEVGAFDKALMLDEECLKKLQLVYGDNHPFTLSKMIKIANDNATTSQKSKIVIEPLHFNNRRKPPPTIRFIDFESLKQRASFPRYPKDKGVNNATYCDNTGLVVELSSIDRSDALLVFVSHCWLRGYEGAPGFDEAVGFHPDNATHDKFKLSLEGIEETMKTMAPGARKCYIWFDFISLDQEGVPAAELYELDRIFESCDCVFTPIHGENRNIDGSSSANNSYEGYQAAAWNEGPHSYTHRSWTRLEMLYAANVPLIEDKARAERLFKHGFKQHVLNGVRPHLLYGTSESKLSECPFILPPLQYSYYKMLDPLDFNGNANLSKKFDRPKIRKLYAKVETYFKKVEEGYEGSRDEYGRPHGKGVYSLADGSRYEGDFVDGKYHGKGVFRYADGDKYEGDFVDGKYCGRGVVTFSSGNRYEGDFVDVKQHGKGVLRFATGDRYEGNFVDGKYHGKGVLSFANGQKYEGDYIDGKYHVKGVLSFASGQKYEGDFADGKQHGKGVLRFSNESRYAGDFVDGKRHGKGVLRFASGDRYEGDFVNGYYHGKGVLSFSSGDRYEGSFIDGKQHGKGVFSFANGESYEGGFFNGIKHGKGVYSFTNGERYDCEWKDGKQHGKGVHCNSYGTSYDGDFVDGVYHGKRVLRFANGKSYEGNFVDGEYHGNGVLCFASGDRYEGDCVDCLQHGKGVYSFVNGERYEGDFITGKQHGKGNYLSANGDCYNGDFVDVKQLGKGVLSFANGDRYAGDFLNGKLCGI